MQRLEGREMRKSFLNSKAIATASAKLCAGKPARTVWEGGDGKGLKGTSPASYFIRGRGGRKSAVRDTTRRYVEQVKEINGTSLASYPT